MQTEVIDRLRDFLAEREEVVTAYLYGSAAIDPSTARDLDVAVVLDEAAEAGATTLLQVEVEAALDVPVDLHDLDGLPLDVQFRVQQTGRVLLDREPTARVRREVRVRNLHEDFAPQLAVIREGARRRLASGG
jgi:predicted nucleotidyltransferase